MINRTAIPIEVQGEVMFQVRHVRVLRDDTEVYKQSTRNGNPVLCPDMVYILTMNRNIADEI